MIRAASLGAALFGMGGLLLGCAGCAPRPAVPPPTPAASAGAARGLTLATDPARPRSLDPTRFTVRWTDAAGGPVAGAHVSVSLAMPSMDMGRNEVALTETAGGVYAGTGRLTMAGEWRATVTARAGGAARTQAFPLTAR